MKKIGLILVLCACTLAASAQDILSSFLEKYEKDESLEVVTIGKKMFEMMATLSADNPEFTEAIKGLDNIRIVSSNDTTLAGEYFESACRLIRKNKNYEELASAKENQEEYLILIRESKGAIKELILLSGKKGAEFNMISLTGNINLKTLAQFASKLNINGLDKLGEVEKK